MGVAGLGGVSAAMNESKVIVPVVTIDEQIEEVRREIALRELLYPRLIRDKHLRPANAEKTLTRMRAALITLYAVKSKSEGA